MYACESIISHTNGCIIHTTQETVEDFFKNKWAAFCSVPAVRRNWFIQSNVPDAIRFSHGLDSIKKDLMEKGLI